jgi:hypothetical protein
LLRPDGAQNVAGLGNVREVDLGLDFVGINSAAAHRPARWLRLAVGLEMGPHLGRFVLFQRTGMGLLLGDPDFCKHVEDRLTLDFQLSGQVVDSNLAHPPFLPPHCPAKSS